MMISTDHLKPMVEGYLKCALWSSVDSETDDHLDDLFDIFDFSDSDIAEAIAVCARFAADAWALLSEPYDDDLTIAERLGWEHIGHNLWLTRNRYGAGFWDRGLPEHIGGGLTQLAHDLGEAYVYAGDDHKPHLED